LAVLGDNGYHPYAVTVSYVYTEGEIYIHSVLHTM